MSEGHYTPPGPHDVIRRDDPEHIELLKNTARSNRVLEGYWTHEEGKGPVRVTGLVDEVQELKEIVTRFTDGFSRLFKWVAGILASLLSAILFAIVLAIKDHVHL